MIAERGLRPSADTVGSTISRETHCGIHINCGPEIGVASTKAYTSQFIALVMMAIQLSEDRISMTERRNQIIDGLHELPGQLRQVLQMDSALKELARTTLVKERSLLISAWRGGAVASAPRLTALQWAAATSTRRAWCVQGSDAWPC